MHQGFHKLTHVCGCSVGLKPMKVVLKPMKVVASEVQPTQESGTAKQPQHVDAAGEAQSALSALAQVTAHGC